MGNKCIPSCTVYYLAQDESRLVADTTTHITNKCVLSKQRGRAEILEGLRVRQVPGLLCDAVWAAHHLPVPSAPIRVREELLSGSRTA